MAIYLIGVDLGSSNTKAVLLDSAGQVVAEHTQDTRPHQPRPGVAEHDPADVYRATLAAMRALLQQTGVPPGEVAAVSLDGVTAGAVGVDARGEAVTPYTTTLDQRFAPYLVAALARGGDRIRQLTGSGQPTLAPKIHWLRAEMPDVYRRCHKFTVISAYVLARLAGLKGGDAFMDYTYLWATGLSDTAHYRWSDELCAALDIPLTKLPRIVRPTDIIGALTPDAARATGLLAGTPLVAGAGDQNAGLMAAGVTEPGMVADSAGTYPVLYLCTDRFQPDVESQMSEIVPSVMPNLWYPSVAITGGGLTHQWFLDTFAHGDAVEGRDIGQDAYTVLEEKAARLPPGAEKVFFIPHLAGRLSPLAPNFRGLWVGFTWAHRREHFYRAILEAVAYDLQVSWRALRATYPDAPVTAVRVYGGGAHSALWNRIKADVMGLPYVRLNRHDLSALGVCLIAGQAVGLYDDMADAARRFVQVAERIEPDARCHAYYQQCVDFYARLLAQASPSYDELAALPDWTP